MEVLFESGRARKSRNENNRNGNLKIIAVKFKNKEVTPCWP